MRCQIVAVLFCSVFWYNTLMTQDKKFPDGFLWGAATSAHQVEGDNRNDWTEWEKKNAERLSKTNGAKYPPENYISDQACDHYSRYEEDFDIAKSLGHNAHRFSIEWSRVEPEEGKFDEKEIEHYRDVIRALRERGMEPFVTLWHWTNPIWFAEAGGWENKKATEYFVRYVEKVVDVLGDVKFWITMNEQEAFARHGYFTKDRPPATGTIFTAYHVLKKLVHAHEQAYQVIKNIRPKSLVGFSESRVFFEPYNRLPHNLLATKLIAWWRNNAFFDQFVKHSDFIGQQYYFHSRVRLNPFVSHWGFQYNENKKVSDMGWELYPEGLYHVLTDLTKYKKPIYITENGLADARDEHRAWFIREHVRWMKKAMDEGADVRGYFYWSLLDNFEWDKGFWPRFGLVEVNYQTLERTIRPSAWEYKKIIMDHEA
ncbi:MAG: beta-glucosidase [Parcubacteria group bacterium Gr01-1014_29]|nr:MAG: beta-glucosidase [Parcubacteria group bacterium Gr01-1014_29]